MLKIFNKGLFFQKYLCKNQYHYIIVAVVCYLGLWLKIDASRRQNDPRKQEKLLRAWCGLEVSPSNKLSRFY